MSHSLSDIKVSSIAFGFTLGFGFLTTWNAIKQTMRSRNPAKSAYIYMIWGELIANAAITVQGYLFLSGVVQFTYVLFFLLVGLWLVEYKADYDVHIVYHMHLYYSHYGCLNCSYSCKSSLIECPSWCQIKRKRRGSNGVQRWRSHLSTSRCSVSGFRQSYKYPKGNSNHTNSTNGNGNYSSVLTNCRYIDINAVWDRIEKIIILLIDATLNWYFIRVVKARLVTQGLTKYDKLVQFNVKIVMVSLTMDALIIGLMSLKNGAVYVDSRFLAVTLPSCISDSGPY